MTDIYKLMQKYGLEHGLENDKVRLDAFVKELEDAVKTMISRDNDAFYDDYCQFFNNQ